MNDDDLGAGREGFQERLAHAAWIVRRVIGAPDYEAYLRHRRRYHPGEPVLTQDEFVKDRMAARYAGLGGRCC